MHYVHPDVGLDHFTRICDHVQEVGSVMIISYLKLVMNTPHANTLKTILNTLTPMYIRTFDTIASGAVHLMASIIAFGTYPLLTANSTLETFAMLSADKRMFLAAISLYNR